MVKLKRKETRPKKKNSTFFGVLQPLRRQKKGQRENLKHLETRRKVDNSSMPRESGHEEVAVGGGLKRGWRMPYHATKGQQEIALARLARTRTL